LNSEFFLHEGVGRPNLVGLETILDRLFVSSLNSGNDMELRCLIALPSVSYTLIIIITLKAVLRRFFLQ